MSDHTEENPSITYDVVVSGNYDFLSKVEFKFKDFDYQDFKRGVMEYCSCCDYREAETLLNGIQKIAKNIIDNWG